MMCLTFSTSTANWIAERQLRSACTTTFATLRCTNISPGINPTIWFAGTRLSEQPIHRYCGACCSVSRAKNCGSCRTIAAAHARLLARRCANSLIAGGSGAGAQYPLFGLVLVEEDLRFDAVSRRQHGAIVAFARHRGR